MKRLGNRSLVAVIGMAVAIGLSQLAWADVSPSQQWMTSGAPDITGPGQTMNIEFGTSGVTATLDVTAGTVGPGNWPVLRGVPITDEAANGPNILPFIEPDAPTGSVSISQGVPIAPGGSQSSVVTFSKPVIAPILHVVNLDGSYVDIGGTTTGGAAITLTALAGNNELGLSGNRLNSDLNPAVVGGCELNDGTNPNGSCGSIRLGTGSQLVQSFTMDNVGIADSWQWALSFPTAPLTKQFSPNRIPAGGTSTLTFSITNPANPSQPDLSPLDFTDVLPAGVTLADGSVTNNGNCGSPSVVDSGGGALGAGDTGVSASNISVAVGATCTITIKVTSSTRGNYINDNDNLSTDVANLIPNASTSLEVYRPRLRINKRTGSTVARPGQVLSFKIDVRNVGNGSARRVRMCDRLPAELTLVRAPGSSSRGAKYACWKVKRLPAKKTRTFTVIARVSMGAVPGAVIRNRATVKANNVKPRHDVARVEVVRPGSCPSGLSLFRC